MRQLNAITLVALLATGLATAGCSYRPLYSKSSGGAELTATLADISVTEQKTRAGQLVRNELIAGFDSRSGSNYVLKMDVSERTQDVSSMAFEKTDRHRYRLTVAYELVDSRTGEAISTGSSFSNVSYDTIQQPVADLRAAENARERAAREIAQDLRLRIASFLSSRPS